MEAVLARVLIRMDFHAQSLHGLPSPFESKGTQQGYLVCMGRDAEEVQSLGISGPSNLREQTAVRADARVRLASLKDHKS